MTTCLRSFKKELFTRFTVRVFVSVYEFVHVFLSLFVLRWDVELNSINY